MALSNYQGRLTKQPTTIIPTIASGSTVILVQALAVNTHPSSPPYLDIIKRSGSTDLYLCCKLQLSVADATRAPYLLPLKGLALKAGESLLARAYGISEADWDTVDWDTVDWDTLTYTSSSSPIDLHITVST